LDGVDSNSSMWVPPPAGLVSKDASDLQGDDSGILRNGASYAAGFVSRAAFSFDGSLDPVVQVGNTPTLKMTTAMTFECWIYPTESRGECVIANREGEYEFSRWMMKLFDGLSQTPIRVGHGLPQGLFAPLQTWTHIAVIYDSGLITTYGNGVQVHQYQGSGLIGDVDPTRNDFRIGNRQQFPTPFPGRIDELKIYNRALTSSEVAAIYAAGSSRNCKPVAFV
jgi:Concanavalin A-like lectin/glucanases superfamily